MVMGCPHIRVKIDREECIGDGLCVDAAPETFELDDDSKAFVVSEPNDAEEDVMRAAQICPIECIAVIDNKTGRTLFPDE